MVLGLAAQLLPTAKGASFVAFELHKVYVNQGLNRFIKKTVWTIYLNICWIRLIY